MKKGQTKGLWIIGLLALIVFGTAIYIFAPYIKGVVQQAIGVPPTPVAKAVAPPFCVYNPSLDLKIRADDSLASGTNYVNFTIYIYDKTTGALHEKTVTTAGNDYASLSDAIPCGHEVEIYSKTTQDGVNGNLLAVLKPEQTQEDPIVLDTKVSKIDNLRARVWDYDEAGFMYNNKAASEGYADLNTSGLKFTSTADNSTPKTINADEWVNLRFHVRTQNADHQLGGDKVLIAVDYADDSNINDWQEPTITVGGVQLSDIKGTLTTNDQEALGAYEKAYLINSPIGETDTLIDFYMLSGAGVNPDYDFKVRFVGNGIHQDDKNPTQLLGTDPNKPVFFRTDTSKTEMCLSTSPILQIDVA